MFRSAPKIASHRRHLRHPHDVRERGAVSILAMMFLVIFSSLAAAMAVVSHGNLSTADAHLKINRALSAAETGMSFVTHRLNLATRDVRTTDGLINASNAPDLWDEVVDLLLNPSYAHSLVGASHNLQEPYSVDGTVHIGPIAVGPNSASRFRAELTRHPMPGEVYHAAYYRQPGFRHLWQAHVETAAGKPLAQVTETELTAALQSWQMPANYVRLRVIGMDGPTGKEITRAVQVDMKMDKKIRFAILSRSRVMVGRNVLIEGPIGSTFMDTHLEHGHPVQIASDFRGLTADLDADLDALKAALASIVDPDAGVQRDRDFDNRLYTYGPEADDLRDPHTNIIDINGDGQHDDVNGDGYIDEYDFFLKRFDTSGNGVITLSDLQAQISNPIVAAQMLELIDSFGNPLRYGINDGQIDGYDQYAKIRGQIMIAAGLDGWLAGAAQGRYQDFFEGPIRPGRGEPPVLFQTDPSAMHTFAPSDFDTESFRVMASNSLAAQASGQAANNPSADPTGPIFDNGGVLEEVPYGAAYPYDYYVRPVYRNMHFSNVTIPKGTNALFIDCTFEGVTFVDTETNNTDHDFNYAGMIEQDGSLKHPDRTVTVNGQVVSDTKSIANNVRFHNCTFEGAVVSAAPQEYTHVRNKLAFTGATQFVIDDSPNLSESEKQLFKRSTLLTPHMSVELGTFTEPDNADEFTELSGTIVAGVMDVRGQARITGTILTTFEPKAGEYPVMGDTSPNFNTTLGYFNSEMGDMEAELPVSGAYGVIQVRYDPTIPLPNGIMGPIELRADRRMYYEVKAN